MAKSSLSWFKHYNNASDGNSLRLLWDAGDFEAYGLWWRLLELVSRWEKMEKRGEIQLSWQTLARETNWKPSKCRRVLSRISSVSKIELEEIPGGYVLFRLPNWSELQRNAGLNKPKKNPSMPGEDRVKSKEDRIKNTESPAQAPIVDEESVKMKNTQEWIYDSNKPEVEKVLKNFWPKGIPKNVQRLSPHILTGFHTVDNFKSWTNDVINSKKAESLELGSYKLQGYFLAALKNHLGV